MLSKYLQHLNFPNIVLAGLEEIWWYAFGSFGIWGSFPTFIVIYLLSLDILFIDVTPLDGGVVPGI